MGLRELLALQPDSSHFLKNQYPELFYFYGLSSLCKAGISAELIGRYQWKIQ
jgi:hypothetical protein